MDLKKIKKISYGLRKKIFQSIYDGNGGHIGGSFSVIDLLTYLYAEILKIDPTNPEDPDRDRLIFSKGHSCQALYWALAEFKFFEEEIIMDYGSDGALFAGHPEFEKAPGIEISSGSLGHGPAIGVGMAYAAKLKNKNFDVYVIVGDGESNEGSVWEAAMSAAQLKLSNFHLIIDNNGMESLEKTDNIMSIEPIDKKLKAFNFDVVRFNGHDFKEIKKAFEINKELSNDKPKAYIADTIKAYGISFTQADTKWHFRAPSDDELEKGLKELDLVIDA
tara:strand:- start:255 stop:1082 length:828 start_codon:yes stop_codon:yes gene_type:complete